jgi:hypothetical protein
VEFDRPNFDEAIRSSEAIAPPQLLQDRPRQCEFGYVLLISCDSVYMRKYGFPFIRSFAKHAQGHNLLHVHVYDPDNRIVDEVNQVAKQAALTRFAISSEICPFAADDAQRRKSYYASGRLIHLPYWLDCYQRPVLSLDVDILVNNSLDCLVNAASGHDLALNRRRPIDSPWLDIIANIIIANPTVAARRYLAAAGRYALQRIERERETWFVDQAALFCMLKMMGRFAKPPAVAWIEESQYACLRHYGAANQHSLHDPEYLKYADSTPV